MVLVDTPTSQVNDLKFKTDVAWENLLFFILNLLTNNAW